MSDDRTALAGWHRDPTGRYEYRYFNGQTWTADVSADGTRFVDHDGLRAAPHRPSLPPGAAPLPPVVRPTRTMAVLAMVFGIFAMATSWMPFIVVLGVGAAITAIVLGIVAGRRIRDGRAVGRAFALAGLVTGVLALPLAVVGFSLTAASVREFTEFVDPGPNEVEIGRCAIDDDRVEVDGLIRNLDDEPHDYEVLVRVEIDGARATTASARLSDVAPGETRRWSTFEFLPDDQRTATDVSCSLFAVYGAFPFGLEPER